MDVAILDIMVKIEASSCYLYTRTLKQKPKLLIRNYEGGNSSNKRTADVNGIFKNSKTQLLNNSTQQFNNSTTQ